MNGINNNMPDHVQVFTKRRISIAVFLLVLLCAGFIASLSDAAAWSNAILRWLVFLRDMGLAGVVIFLLLQVLVAMVGVLPASLIGIAAGAVYGVVIGFGLSACGVLVGAAISFGLTRSTLRPSIVKVLEKRAGLTRFDTAFGRDGWRIVLLLRISPIMPFSITSYALGLSSVRFQDYAVGTFASLPALFLYVIIGTLGAHSIAAAENNASNVHIAIFGIGIFITALLTLKIGHMIRASLRQI